MDNNLFTRSEENPVRKALPNVDVSKPVPYGLAVALSAPQQPRANRALRRAGAAYIWAPAAQPSRHTVCHVCDKRTFTSKAGTCRKCFLAGAGPVEEVSF